MDLGNITAKELLRLQASATNELLKREIVRTRNNPLGDYTEWLVAKALGLTLSSNSKAGYDGVDSQGIRVQIKGRRIFRRSKSRQLSAIRKYAGKDFDQLAAVIFDEDFEVIEAYLIPYHVVGEYALYREHVNAHVLTLRGRILADHRVKCIKEVLRG
ncbi:DUF6998 domain-containing protein [Vreelandella populi]|uniref:DUF6998 domain-containing protein n=1 Tax=Vreelandella populi TaxID=2498858 RepID=UPI000F8E02A3|nr:hypothetical protein [Halomonas populi]RUR53185.1 hypothetical protein ELY40_14285 [Halomonas populi]